MAESKKRSFTRFLKNNWKVIAFIIVISIFLNGQGCTCGSPSDSKGDGATTSAENEAYKWTQLLGQMGLSYCTATALSQSGLCGGNGTDQKTPNPCANCPSGSGGDPCRQVCTDLSAPQLSGTKLIKTETSFVYGYEINMNVVDKSIIYTAYFTDSSGTKHSISTCAGTSAQGSVVHCAETGIKSTDDNLQVCIDYYVSGAAKTQCKDLTVTHAPAIEPGSPLGGQAIGEQEYNIYQNQQFILPLQGVNPDCTEQTGCFRYTYTSQPAINSARFTLNQVTGEIRFKPAQEDVGSYTLTVNLIDTAEQTSTLIIVLHVLDVNDPPVLSIPQISTPEDDAVTFDLKQYTADPDPGETMSWSAITVPNSHLSISLSPDGTAVITPAEKWHGSEAVNFTVSDGELSASEKVNVTVTFTPHTPYVSPMPQIVKDENFEKFTYSLASYKHDDDYGADNLTWSIVSYETNMITATLSHDTLTLEPVQNANGNTVISLQLINPANNKATYDLPVTIRHINQPPVIAEIPDITISDNESYTLDLNAFVKDPDNPSADLRWAVHYATPEIRTTYDYKSQTMKFEKNPGYNNTPGKMLELVVTDFGESTSQFVNVNILNS